MREKIIIYIMIICIIIISTFFIIIKNLSSEIIHDEMKKEITFNNITSLKETAIELNKGKNNIDIYLEKGSIDIKIYSERDIIVEETIKTSKKIEVEVSRKGGYVINIIGKHGKGIIKY